MTLELTDPNTRNEVEEILTPEALTSDAARLTLPADEQMA